MFDYKIDDDSIATVDENGLITGLAIGTTTIRATVTSDTSVTFEASVNVYESNFKFSKETYHLILDRDHSKESAIIYDGNNEATWRDFTFAIDDNDIAKVNSQGEITALKEGKTTITAIYKRNPEIVLSADVDVSIDYGADVDGDGLCDYWELYGVDCDGDGVIDIDLPNMGANPSVPDLYVEVDIMRSKYENYNSAEKFMLELFQVDVSDYSPKNKYELQMVCDEFRAHGIELHIDAGASSCNYKGPSESNMIPFTEEVYSNWDELLKENFSEERQRVFRHAMFVSVWAPGEPSSGIAKGITSQHFIITDPDRKYTQITGYLGRTFMHELGHTLGLRHGGKDDINYKPNYISIMNYDYQFYGFPGDGAYEAHYSDYLLPPLNENKLIEADGLDPKGITAERELKANFSVWPSGLDKYVRIPKYNDEDNDGVRDGLIIANTPIDFNQNGSIDEEPVKVLLSKSSADEFDKEYTVLTSANDWENIEYIGGNIGNTSFIQAGEELNESNPEDEQIGASLEELIENGTFASPGTGEIDAINPTVFSNGEDKSKLYIRIKNYGSTQAKYTLKLEGNEIIEDYENSIVVEGSVTDIAYKDVEIPIKEGVVNGDYIVKATLSYPGKDDKLEDISVSIYTPTEEEIGIMKEVINDNDSDLPEILKDIYEEYVEENETYNITYELKGGVNSEKNPQTYSKSEIDIELMDATREGYIFGGWYDNEEFTGEKITKISAGSAQDLFLYAKWIESHVHDLKAEEVVATCTTTGIKKYWFCSECGKYYSDQGGGNEIIDIEEWKLSDGAIPMLGHSPSDWKFDQEKHWKVCNVETCGAEIEDSRSLHSFNDQFVCDVCGFEKEIPQGLWVAGIEKEGYDYIGSAIKPVVRVYDHKTLLTENKDYTISYKNNKKAYTLTEGDTDYRSKNAPTITVRGKGNYSGTEKITFKILPKNITDNDVVASDIVLKANSKTQKPVPVVMWNGKKLKNKTDFTVEYVELTAGENGANKDAGTYTTLIKGKGNYIGERTVTFTITENKLISKATVSKIKEQNYTGTAIKPSFTVKFGKATMVEGTDYTVSYQNNTEIGTATIILAGIGDYSGEKKINFKIKGTAISKATVTGIPKTVEYTGTEITTDSASWGAKPVLTAIVNGEEKTLKEGTDYTISYQKNIDKGTAAILFKGINGYSGTLKKNFTISAYNIATDSADMFKVSDISPVVYTKGGSKPDVEIRFNGKLLKNVQDYTLKYKKNQAITQGTPSAEVEISGKGNFAGKITRYFQIDLSTMEDNVTLTIADKAVSSKKGGYRSEPVLVDINGKKLVKNKDYYKDIKYYLVNEDGSENLLLKDSVAEVGSLIKVYVEGFSNYEGTISATYVITPISFNKTKIKIAAKEYTGKEITLDKSDITIKYKGTKLQDSDYEIASYSNNVKKGKAKVTIKGVGNYGGTQTVTFTIKSKGFLWWWR